MWLSVLVAAGVAATATFSTLPKPELSLTLERFAEFDQSQHGRIAAGMVMEPVFTFVDLVQVVAALGVVVTLILQIAFFHVRLWSIANVLRMVLIAIAIGSFAWRAFTITPQMNSDLRAYWSAAEAGETETALHYRQSFDALHPKASTSFQWSMVALVLTVAASAVAIGPGLQQTVAPTKIERPKLAS